MDNGFIEAWYVIRWLLSENIDKYIGEGNSQEGERARLAAYAFQDAFGNDQEDGGKAPGGQHKGYIRGYAGIRHAYKGAAIYGRGQVLKIGFVPPDIRQQGGECAGKRGCQHRSQA